MPPNRAFSHTGKTGLAWTQGDSEGARAIFGASLGRLQINSTLSDANYIVAALSHPVGLTHVQDGAIGWMIPLANNTGPVTVDFGLGPLALRDRAGRALNPGTLVADRAVRFTYNWNDGYLRLTTARPYTAPDPDPTPELVTTFELSASLTLQEADIDLGEAHEKRFFVISIGAHITSVGTNTATLTISSVTLGGVAATIVEQSNHTGLSSSYAYGALRGAICTVAVPEGATGDLDIELAQTNGTTSTILCYGTIIRSYLASETEYDSASSAASNATSHSDTVTLPDQGFLVQIGMINEPTTAFSAPSGLDTDYDTENKWIFGSLAFGGLASPVTGTVTGGSPTAANRELMIMASWEIP